jgi:pilus assembly protein Flp/PilA
MVRLLTAKNKLVAAARKFFTKKEEGASMVEYGLLVALIAVVVAVAATTLGTGISTLFSDVAGTLAG